MSYIYIRYIDSNEIIATQFSSLPSGDDVFDVASCAAAAGDKEAGLVLLASPRGTAPIGPEIFALGRQWCSVSPRCVTIAIRGSPVFHALDASPPGRVYIYICSNRTPSCVSSESASLLHCILTHYCDSTVTRKKAVFCCFRDALKLALALAQKKSSRR